MTHSVKEESMTADGLVSTPSEVNGITDDGDRTPTKAMNRLVHYDVLEESECKPVRGVSAHADDIQRKCAPSDFHWSQSPELHKIRRKKILKAHPEILKVQGPDPLAAVFCTATVLVQLFTCYIVRDWSWPSLLIVTYIVSGTMNHSLVLAMHELSHDLFFKSKMLNKVFSIFCNLPTGVASAATFRRYHLEHHSSQGVDKIDVDIPTHAEAKFFRSVPGRFTWALFQPVFYGLRPMVIRPLPMVNYEAINWLVQLTFDIVVLKFLGLKSFFYLLWGSFFGLGLHPMSGHFIAEHLEAVYGQETFSYYGPLNLLAYNVGYHNEHHDFPTVAGRNLPKVKALAPEWYDMPSYDSWTRVLYDFVTKGNTNLYCRVKRTKA
ncbi:membrane fatty acid desaturase, putative [Perkinsus marinus ATCC 50983]|uniref:sphingolipid 4-desaturase n=1 Tax=Perkinsus marinus (strain ATCC 50983 / TXsc) TaxID=423536 RepID=C5LJG2_PERM5|nr:membrane fatty acid desaturase, putative [Perkinsus marinus ATCC 50983]EER03091.1 membrane fatty acid desaturase, putative [Perkinsus marinus ATCC 50983]|eukprot:XP_002771275.1 membrane fatty acid desaturase, putative [Perkinsus marinus ATCC 50983]